MWTARDILVLGIEQADAYHHGNRVDGHGPAWASWVFEHVLRWGIAGHVAYPGGRCHVCRGSWAKALTISSGLRGRNARVFQRDFPDRYREGGSRVVCQHGFHHA